MQCRNCSGNEFRETVSGNFKCSYCGTLYYEEKKQAVYLKKRSLRAVLLAGVGLLVLTLALLLVMVKPWGKTDEKIKTDAADSSYTFNNVEKLQEPSAELIRVDLIPDSTGNLYFLVICKNTGKVAIKQPRLTVRLFSSKNEKVATGTGYGLAANLNPNEETPVYVLVKDCPEYSRYEIDFQPELPYIIPDGGVFKKVFSAEIAGASVKPGPYEDTYIARGKIINRSPHTGSYVQVAVLLYDGQNKALGYASTYIHEKKLKPGDFDFFEVIFYGIGSEPDHYKIFYNGGAD